MDKQQTLKNEYKEANRVELHSCTGTDESGGMFAEVEAVKQAFENGHPAIAIVDHCSVRNFSAAARTAKQLKWKNRESGRSIKVIWGVEVEFYSNSDAGYSKVVDRNEHFIINSAVLLAKNRVGLKNLNRIMSYYLMARGNKGMITRSTIEWLREGLYVGASAKGGEVSNFIAAGKPTKELKQIAAFYDFLEIQPYFGVHDHANDGLEVVIKHTRSNNKKILEIGDAVMIPTVAVASVHSDTNINLERIKTTEEMLKEFSYLRDRAFEVVVINPNKIADSIDEIGPIHEGAFYPSVKSADTIIRGLCYEKVRDLYGENLPYAVSARLERELEIIIGNGEDSIYVLNREIVRNACNDGNPVAYRGLIGGSLVSYLIGLTEVNPLPPHYVCPACKRYHEVDSTEPWVVGEDIPDRICPDCNKYMKKYGFNIPALTLFGLRGDRFPDIDIVVPSDYQNKEKYVVRDLLKGCQTIRAGKVTSSCGRYITEADEYGLFVVPAPMDIEDFTPIQYGYNSSGQRCIVTHQDWKCLDSDLLKIDVIADKSLQLLKELAEKTDVNIDGISLRDDRVLQSFSSYEALDIHRDGYILSGGAFGVYDFDNESMRDILKYIKPETVSELVKCYGLSWGTGTWNETIRSLMLNKEVSIGNVVSSREDIYVTLKNKGMPPDQAYKVMDLVRKGRELSEQQLLELTQAGLPEWWIDSLQNGRFFSIRAQDVIRTITGIRLAWFKVNYPDDFYNIWLNNDEYYYSHSADINKLDMRSLENRIRAIRKERSDSEIYSENEELTVYQVLYEMSARGLKLQ